MLVSKIPQNGSTMHITAPPVPRAWPECQAESVLDIPAARGMVLDDLLKKNKGGEDIVYLFENEQNQ